MSDVSQNQILGHENMFEYFSLFLLTLSFVFRAQPFKTFEKIFEIELEKLKN